MTETLERPDVLAAFKEDDYRWEDLQAIVYDRERTDLFPDGYIGALYHLAKNSRRRSGDGILTTIFGGNPPSHFDSIVSYLAPRPLIIMGVWEGETFRPAGFAFIQLFCGVKPPEKACFAGYGFFREFWGTEVIYTAMMLGLCLLFQEFGVKAVHGTRFEDNRLTKRFTEHFGFHVTGEIPYYQLKDGKLVSGIVSTLTRVDFVEYVETWLRGQWQQAKQEVTIKPDPEMPLPVSNGENVTWMTEVIAEDEYGNLLESAVVPQDVAVVEEQVMLFIARHPKCRWRTNPVKSTSVLDTPPSAPPPPPEIESEVRSAQPVPRGGEGGRARAAKLSHERRREIAQKAANARWNPS